ncbi:MAG: hypothetical protein ACI94Y_002572 [Maribacter sp.]|jgi:hypothetical protein
MEIKVIQEIDENYYQEFYSEWLLFRNRFKKWEDKIGVLSLMIAIGIFVLNDSLSFISIGLLVFGTLMIYEFYASKKNGWIVD